MMEKSKTIISIHIESDDDLTFGVKPNLLSKMFRELPPIKRQAFFKRIEATLSHAQRVVADLYEDAQTNERK